MAAQSIYSITHWNAIAIKDPATPASAIKPQGVITDLTLPTLERDVDTTKRAGELGIVPRPKFFNEMELSFTVQAYYKEFLLALAEAMQVAYTLRVNVCLENDAGAITPYVVEAKGFVTSLPFGDLSADGLESEVTFMAYYLKATLDTTIIIYDPRNYIYSIGGVNLLDAEKTALANIT